MGDVIPYCFSDEVEESTDPPLWKENKEICFQRDILQKQKLITWRQQQQFIYLNWKTRIGKQPRLKKNRSDIIDDKKEKPGVAEHFVCLRKCCNH